jgi:hypothetical protein
MQVRVKTRDCICIPSLDAFLFCCCSLYVLSQPGRDNVSHAGRFYPDCNHVSSEGISRIDFI